jgi:multidrug efflux pump subunit AcrB
VIWQYAGLDAQEIEERIVYAHERALSATVNDIEHIESSSFNGVGVIKVFLQPGASVDAGVAQITAIAQTILRLLPPGQQPPLVIRYNASTVPILQYSVSSKTMSEQELYDSSQNQIRIGLATVQGAAVPWPYGGKTRVVAVDLDLTALKAKNLSPQDVVTAINAQNLVFPSGTAKIGATEFDVELNTSPKVVEELNDLPVQTVNGATIYIREVAQVRDGYQPQQNVVRQDGLRGALLTILKSGSASTLDVVRQVKEAMPKIMKTLPPELEVKEFADQSLFVRAAVNDVVKEGVIAAALTAAMILLFLGSWRSTLIIALSIPLSVLVSLAILSALGETINLMTLGGLAWPWAFSWTMPLWRSKTFIGIWLRVKCSNRPFWMERRKSRCRPSFQPFAFALSSCRCFSLPASLVIYSSRSPKRSCSRCWPVMSFHARWCRRW